MQKPTVGRIVHYVSEGSPVLPDGTQKFKSVCRAAIITDTEITVPYHPLAIGLAVLQPHGMYFNVHVPFDEWDGNTALEGALPKGGSWHWPERSE